MPTTNIASEDLSNLAPPQPPLDGTHQERPTSKVDAGSITVPSVPKDSMMKGRAVLPASAPVVAKQVKAADIKVSSSSPQHTSPISSVGAAPLPNPLPAVAFKSNLEGALWWLRFGYKVTPLVPGQKWPILPHYPWLDDLNEERIKEHWELHPDHEVGAILDPTQLVLDADTNEAQAALLRLEERFGVTPSLIIKTRRGFHHHYRLTDGTFAKADSHHTLDFPDRIDVRANNNSVILTPSRDKSVHYLTARDWGGLACVGQDFVDAVFQHNGRAVPRPLPDIPEDSPAPTIELATLSKLLSHIDADCGYQDWLTVLMALFHETRGSEDGLDLADSWSRKARSYKGRADVEAKWRSFRTDVANPITIATLIARAREAGADVSAFTQDAFQPCETVVCDATTVPARAPKASPFRQFSLIGQAEKYQAMAQDATPLLDNVCFNGEATVWYAKHNTGKTLLTLHMLSEAVEHGRIAPDDIYFINADDSSAGIAEKLAMLDEIGAHTLVPGQGGFKAEDLPELMLSAARNGTAQGSFVIVDTLKKFVDLMHKRQSSEFANVCRQFVAAGGSVLGLAHTNKRKSEDGKAVHAGTTDILDDFDAGYILDELPITGSPGEKLVEFTRQKSRGGGVQSVAYAYAAEENLSYAERLASVRLVDPSNLENLKCDDEVRSDADVIAAISDCIKAGVGGKIALRNAVAERAEISRRAAEKVIKRYTGNDPDKHLWAFSRVDRGRMMFSLLSDTTTHHETGPSAPS